MPKMTTKHTPEWDVCDDSTPWTCGDAQTAVEHGEPFGHTEILTPITDGDEVVAYVPWEPLVGDVRQAELRMRASLIAAAPELREQLLMLVRWCEDQGETCAFARALLARIDED